MNKRLLTAVAVALVGAAPLAVAGRLPSIPVGHFDRVATYYVPEGVAEIVSATPDGRTLVYTDSATGKVRFVDLQDPTRPQDAGSVVTAGTPTSVTVTPDGRWALAAVDTSVDFVDTAGELLVIDLATRTAAAAIPLGGQPDSVAVGPDGRYAAVVVENERDEAVNDGALPQLPAGYLVVVDLRGAPSAWQTRRVTLTGLGPECRFADDPEPEFVDVNAHNRAAVTLQENNCVVLVDLESGEVTDRWSAGTSTHLADTYDDDDIALDDDLNEARREPDAIAWTPWGELVTANEGDYDLDVDSAEQTFVGGRDFTVFTAAGEVAYEPLAAFEADAVRHGHYDDARSDAKGCEPEGIEIGVYRRQPFLFVGAERCHFVAVYRLGRHGHPEFVQLLPTGLRPEGLHAIPARNLFVAANEDDGTISVFQGRPGNWPRDYPDVVSPSAELPWSALSGLARGRGRNLYAVPDSAFKPSRIFTLELTGPRPAVVTDALPLTRAGSPVSYDLEGIETVEGGWWLASEGNASTTENLLVRVDGAGAVLEEVRLPQELAAQATPSGFEGVAASADGSHLYVAIQREWKDDPKGFVKIGRYTPATGEWRFFRYPLDAPGAGAWVGLSEITRLAGDTFAVIERDNQAGPRARVKRVYAFSVRGVEPVAYGTGDPPLVAKTLVRDVLVADGVRLEKAEGLALTPWGEAVLVYDNDGAGETRLVRFWPMLKGGR